MSKLSDKIKQAKKSMEISMNEQKLEEKVLTPEEKKKIEGFVKPLPQGSHTRCPLTKRICDGKTCALWLDPFQSYLKLISKMCLFRLAMKKIAGE